MMNLRYLTWCVAATVALTASPVWAHAHLAKSDPAMNASVKNQKQLSLTFSERLVPAFSKLQLLMAMNGHNMAVPLKTGVTGGGRTLVGTPQRALMKGAYIINWTAATSDGHRMTGSVRFKVS